MTWSRRQWLQCAGVVSGAALWSLSCGGARPGIGRADDAEANDDVQGALRDAVEAASGASTSAARWARVEGLALRHEHVAAAVDVQGASSSAARRSLAALLATDTRGRRFEVSTSRLDREGLLELASQLLELAGTLHLPAHPAPSAAVRAAARRGVASSATPPGVTPAALHARTTALAERAERRGSSRIVYRGAGIDLDATTKWHAGPEGDRQQVLRRSRHAVTVVAWTGSRPLGAEIASGRSAPVDRDPGRAPGRRGEDAWAGEGADQGPSEAEVAEAIEQVLRLTTPVDITAGPATVVLDPSLVGQIFGALSAALHDPAQLPALARWRSSPRGAAQTRWRLHDAAPTEGAYAALAGWDVPEDHAAPRELLRDGQLGAAILGASGKVLDPGATPRWGPSGLGSWRHAPAHLELVPEGAVDLAALSSGVKAGFALEGGTLASVDFAADRLIAHARLARELRGGTYSGRSFAEIELTARLSEFLATIAGWSSQRRALSRREPGDDGWPRFTSASMPSLLGRVELRPRGRS